MSRRTKSVQDASRLSNDANAQPADVTWQELQGLADRVRILKRVIATLSDSIRKMQGRARVHRKQSILLSEK